jgi:hypothetical protein
MDVVMGGIAMVTRLRPALGAGLVTTLALTVAAPALGAFEAVEPNPIRAGRTIRVLDMAAAGNAVALGWREGASPGELVMALSTNRGISYERDNGNLRSFPVAGIGRLGMALEICGDAVWMASSARFPGDDAGDTDVLISRRGIDGGASQVFVTAPAADRKVRTVDIACVGSRLLAIAWIEQSGDSTRARLLLRDFDSISPTAVSLSAAARIGPSATNSLHNLGQADGQDGIAVASTGSRVFVSWSSGARRNLQLKRFDIGSGNDPTIDPRPSERMGFRDAVRPKLTARGDKIVLAYSDDGKLKARISRNLGASFSAAETLLTQGTVNRPSFATSASMSGARIVIEAMKKQPNAESRTHAPVRIQSTNAGDSWNISSEFGNRGPRMGALRKVSNSVSRLNESWHDDGPSVDVLRAQREVAG